VRVVAPNGNQWTVPLKGRRPAPGRAGDDGDYGGRFDQTFVAGNYDLTFVADGIQGNQTFHREAHRTKPVFDKRRPRRTTAAGPTGASAVVPLGRQGAARTERADATATGRAQAAETEAEAEGHRERRSAGLGATPEETVAGQNCHAAVPRGRPRTRPRAVRAGVDAVGIPYSGDRMCKPTP